MIQNQQTVFLLHMHNHAGWFTQSIQAENLTEALVKGLDKRAGFLSKEYTGLYQVEYDDPLSEFPRYRVIWDSSTPKYFPFDQPLQKGDVWWSDRFQVGGLEDCEKCGGTGVNHYNPFNQCWSCGDSNQEGKGTGKNKATPK